MEFDTISFLKISRKVFKFQLEAIYPLISKNNQTLNLLALNHDRNSSSFLTIIDLVKRKRVADVYTISRSIFESIISMGILAKHVIKDDIERYLNYQFIQTEKVYSHLKKLNREHLSGVPKNKVEYLNRMKTQYINKFGKGNHPTWTGKSLEQNTKLLDKAYPPTCNSSNFYEYLYCQVYRKASQCAHASFAGLSKCVEVTRIANFDGLSHQTLESNEPHLIFSCFHALIVFFASARFVGGLLGNDKIENYFQEICGQIISK